jgi:uncharacterized caspase-like protein
VTAESFEVKAFTIPLATGANDVTVTAENEVGVSAPLTSHLYHVGEGELVRGALHIVAIGVNLYPEAAGVYANLNAAVHDAVSFAKTAVSEIGRPYASTEVRLLVNRAELTEPVAWPVIEPTRTNIETTLSALETVGQGDMVVLFVAGHGERRGDRYFFLPTDVRKKLGDKPGEGDNLMDWTAIMARLTKAKGVRVLFVDTCHSGGAHITTLREDARQQRFVAFAAASSLGISGADALAREEGGHGFFTLAATDGLKGKAREPDEDRVRVNGLGTFITREVRRLSKGRQEPEFNTGLGDIVLVTR